MNPWQTIGSEIILENAWFKVHRDDIVTPMGKPGQYTYMENKPFVLVVGIGKKGWILVRQYRYAVKQIMTEFPAGAIEKGETPLVAAKREFLEETGYAAARWTKLGTIFEQLSTNNCQGTVFLAQELADTREHKMREDGIDRVVLVNSAEIQSQIMNNKIVDAKTIAAYFRASQYMENGRTRS